jgi:hypothetical protein
LPAVAAENRDLLVVEDLLDALLLHQHGIRNAAAIGGSVASLGPDRWEQLPELGIRRLTLLLTLGPYRPRQVERLLENLARARQAPAVFLVRPEVIPEGLGLNDLLSTLGPDWLCDRVAAERLHVFQYQAAAIARKHRPAGGWTDAARQAAATEGMQFYTRQRAEKVPEFHLFFVPALVEALELAWNAWPPSEDAWVGEEQPSEPSPSPALPLNIDGASATNVVIACPRPTGEAADEMPSCVAIVALPLDADDVVWAADHTPSATEGFPTAAACPAEQPPPVADLPEVLLSPEADEAGAAAPLPVEPVDSSPDNPPEEPAPKTENAVAEDVVARKNGRLTGYCEIHRCSVTKCLCWD